SEESMDKSGSIFGAALVAGPLLVVAALALGAASPGDQAMKYPDWKGQWLRQTVPEGPASPSRRRRPALLRSQQGVGQGAGGAADAGIPGDPRSQPEVPGGGQVL